MKLIHRRRMISSADLY
ncbi:unnamed protein product, partial [Allacma fusca]